MATLAAGDSAPKFELSDQDNQMVKLEDFRGKKLLVYFYPRADTSGCTKQACSVRDAREELADLGIDVVGIRQTSPVNKKTSTPSTAWASVCSLIRTM